MAIQRAKVQWLNEGDRNTSFFHAQASQRKAKNEIKGLRDGNGELQTDLQSMSNIAVDYYKYIFSSVRPSEEDIAAALEFVERKVSQELNQELSRPFTAKEVKDSLFQMYPLKSPRPDGFPVLFFQKY